MVSTQPHLFSFFSLHCARAVGILHVAAVPQMLEFYFEVAKVPVVLIDN